MIELSYCKIRPDDVSLIGSINFETFGGYKTVIMIGPDNYQLDLNLAHKMRAWESDIRGYWQDYLFTQIDNMCKNIQNDALKSVNMNIGFTYGGVSLTIEVKFTKLLNDLKKIKKIIKQKKTEA